MVVGNRAIIAVLLCFLSSICFFVLVSTPSKVDRITVLRASRAIPNGKVLEAESIFEEKVQSDETPNGLVTSMSDAVGRLSLGIESGQVIIHKNHEPGLRGIDIGKAPDSRRTQAFAPLTKGIYTNGVAWNPSENVGTTGGISGKARANSACTIEFRKEFISGKAACVSTEEEDLSNYDQLAFFIRSSETLTSGVLRIDLCSDRNGETPVNQLVLPDINKQVWKRIELNNGSAFGRQVQSIRMWCVKDPNTVKITIDSVFACKADSGNAMPQVPIRPCCEGTFVIRDVIRKPRKASLLK